MNSNESRKTMKNQYLKYSNSLHKNLDKFIQNCLNKFQFVEPKKELYDICGEDNNSIISHKSTIPDLVIWNKTFNKNECFEGCDTSEISPFPRYKFFLRFNQNKDKKKKPDKKKKKNKNKSNNSKQKDSSNKSNLKSNSEINEEKVFDKSTPLEANNSNGVEDLMEQLDLKNNKDENTKENYYAQDSKDKTDKKENNKSSIVENEINNDISINYKNSSDFIKSISSHHHSEQNNQKSVSNSNSKSFNNINNFKYNNSVSSKKFNNNNQLFKNSSFQNMNNYYSNGHYYESKYKNSNLCDSFLSTNKSNKYSLLSSSVKNDKKSMNDYYQNQFKQNELLMNLVYSYLDKKGWIVFNNNRNYICSFTSFELFAFLTNILKNNTELKNYFVGMTENSSMFNGEQIYIILSQTLPIILQKKQYDLMQYEKEIETKNEINEKDNSKVNECRCHFNNNCNNLEVEDCKDVCGISEEDENYDFNLNGNNFFMNEQQESKYDNFDSSLFAQRHK